MKKIIFVNDGQPAINDVNLNAMQNNIEEAISYSTTEHEVGKWIDGKTLYEKTIVGTKQSGVDFTAIIGTDVDTAFVVSGYLLATINTVYSLNRYENDYTYTRTEIYENQFTFKSSTGQYTNGTVVATIRYTKNEESA